MLETAEELEASGDAVSLSEAFGRKTRASCEKVLEDEMVSPYAVGILIIIPFHTKELDGQVLPIRLVWQVCLFSSDAIIACSRTRIPRAAKDPSKVGKYQLLIGRMTKWEAPFGRCRR